MDRIAIEHPETGHTTVVGAAAVPVYEQRGWRRTGEVSDSSEAAAGEEKPRRRTTTTDT